MPDEYQQSPRFDKVKGDVIYNFHEALPPPPTPPVPPRKPFRLGQWGWISSGIAALALVGGTFAQLNARTVYYCASHNTVKYHTDATCPQLQHCGARVKSMQLGKAKDKMELCKSCH